MLVFFFEIWNIIEWSVISFTALVKTIFIHSCYNISDSNSTKYFHLFSPYDLLCMLQLYKIVFSNLLCMFHVFFKLISFHCYKGNQKMKSATAQIDCYTNVDKRIVEDDLVKPTHMIFFIFTFFFCISNDWFILFNLFPLLYLLTAIFHNQVIITKVSWSYCCTGFKTEGTCQKYWVPSSTGLGMQ